MRILEGAFTNEGLYWISPKGEIIPVNVPPYEGQYSHEEYAQEKWGISLEDALAKKYIRVQAIKGNYLFIDHKQRVIKKAQVAPLESFFYQPMGEEIPYKQIIVERINDDLREFKGDQTHTALSFAIDGTEDSGLSIKAPSSQAELDKKRDMEIMHPYYKSKSMGDCVMSFKNWLRLG
jgi:hypothetical protein